MNLIVILSKKRKVWIKKYYRIIREIETMANIQLQLQNIIKLAKIVNTQLVEIKTTILQASDSYKTQTAENIFSISEDLQNTI